MSRLAARPLALLFAAIAPDLRSPATWATGALAIGGSAITWKLVVFVYCDFVRPRLDRFVRDSRLRSGAADDAITLGILARNGGAFDDHIVGALDREADRFRNAVGDALSARVADHGAFLRERVFAEEIRETARWRARIDESKETLAAVTAALEGVSAAQLAQGRALAEMPRMSGTMDALATTIAKFAASIDAVTARLEALAIGQGEMRGALDLVRALVLTGRPPEGVEERRHATRRAEDIATTIATTIARESREYPIPETPEGTE